MAKKDWTLILKDEAGTMYRIMRGDYQVDLIAFGNWREYCALRFYKYNKQRHGYDRVTTTGADWYENPEDAPTFPTCAQAEKFALAWLNK